MGIPQILMIILYSMALAISMCKHGETETKTENVGSTIFDIVIQASILYFGGFWQ